ncbi:MAG: hypothetical protein Q8Q41_04540 [bacterium]|nr:hypothetical protein [bacterium]
MVARLAVALALAFFVLIPPAPSTGDDKPSLAVSIVVDPLLRDRFKSQEEFEVHILNIISRASLIFHAEVGRRLVPGAIEIGLPPDAGSSIDDKSAFAWLSEKLKRRPSRFWVFLIDRPLTSCHIPGIWSGCGMMNDPRAIVVYNSDARYVAQNLLHEIGHNCGADHSESKESIMYLFDQGAATYGDKAGIIREKCG